MENLYPTTIPLSLITNYLAYAAIAAVIVGFIVGLFYCFRNRMSKAYKNGYLVSFFISLSIIAVSLVTDSCSYGCYTTTVVTAIGISFVASLFSILGIALAGLLRSAYDHLSGYQG